MNLLAHLKIKIKRKKWCSQTLSHPNIIYKMSEENILIIESECEIIRPIFIYILAFFPIKINIKKFFKALKIIIINLWNMKWII